MYKGKLKEIKLGEMHGVRLPNQKEIRLERAAIYKKYFSYGKKV